MSKEQISYKDAGVDIDLATELLSRVKPALAGARRPEMLAPIGGFGGLSRWISPNTKNLFWFPVSTASAQN
ncbi:MAG: hypothetical protein IKB16_00300 [Lentisphaeria bacterium]|nr:hypothetical protein [Lentisphaeria bacterium]